MDPGLWPSGIECVGHSGCQNLLPEGGSAPSTPPNGLENPFSVRKRACDAETNPTKIGRLRLRELLLLLQILGVFAAELVFQALHFLVLAEVTTDLDRSLECARTDVIIFQRHGNRLEDLQ